MSILVTGGAGFIGSHTAVELIKKGEDVIIADDLSNSSREVMDHITSITGTRPKFYQIDVADKKKLTEVFQENDIETVIHCAGYKAVKESVEKPLMYYRNNIDSTLSLLEVMKDFEVNHFIFSSSATVYGLNGEVPFVETSQTGGCTNPYGWTKYMIEQILQDAAKTDEKMSVVLLRYFNPIGAHESGLIGEKPNGIPNNLMPYITQVASGVLKQLSVYGNDYPTVDGTGVRDYIHIVDLAKGHVAAVSYAREHTGTEIFNLGTGKAYSVLELINAFEEVNGVKIPYQIADRRPGDIAACYADTKKAEELLGWKAKKDIKDMCRDSWNWQLHGSQN